jgi:hypothetical protein
MNIEQIARVCHQANKAFCESIGDLSQESWDHAEQWKRESAIKSVTYALANPGASASAQHEAWLRDKARDGWKFGPVKDAEKKEHPCILPYSELSQEHKTKDHLFHAVVMAFVKAESGAARSRGSGRTHRSNRGQRQVRSHWRNGVHLRGGRSHSRKKAPPISS